MTEIAVLNHAEQVALEECERVIGEGLKTFVAVGSSLAFVLQNRLYRGTHQTFEAYARERWNLSRPRAYQLMEAADVVSNFLDTDQAPPLVEAQARALAKVPEPDRAEVWAETVERTDGKPTAAAIREVHEERTRPPFPGPSDAAVTAPPVGPGSTDTPRLGVGLAAAADAAVKEAVVYDKFATWSDDERGLLKRLRDNETVVVSLRTHANLIEWATEAGLYERVDRRTPWGNPFEMPGDGTRDEVIANYADHYLPHKPSLLNRIESLAGKALGCWCAPEACHADVLKEATEQ